MYEVATEIHLDEMKTLQLSTLTIRRSLQLEKIIYENICGDFAKIKFVQNNTIVKSYTTNLKIL